MLEPVGLLKSWEKLLCISGELTVKTNTAILKQKNLRWIAYSLPCASFSLPTKFKHYYFLLNVKYSLASFKICHQGGSEVPVSIWMMLWTVTCKLTTANKGAIDFTVCCLLLWSMFNMTLVEFLGRDNKVILNLVVNYLKTLTTHTNVPMGWFQRGY